MLNSVVFVHVFQNELTAPLSLFVNTLPANKRPVCNLAFTLSTFLLRTQAMNSCEHTQSRHTSQYTTYLNLLGRGLDICLVVVVLCHHTIQEPYSVFMELGGKFQGKKR